MARLRAAEPQSWWSPARRSLANYLTGRPDPAKKGYTNLPQRQVLILENYLAVHPEGTAMEALRAEEPARRSLANYLAAHPEMSPSYISPDPVKKGYTNLPQGQVVSSSYTTRARASGPSS